MSALSDKALEIARLQLNTGVRGGVFPPWGRFRGPQPDLYQRSVGLHLDPDPSVHGYPWCAAAIFWCFESAAQLLGVKNPCPRTAGAIHMWDAAQDAHGTHSPASGCVFVLDRGSGRGHVGFVEADASGSIWHGPALLTLEPDTSNTVLSATGDAWGRHEWDPREGKRGTLLGYLAF